MEDRRYKKASYSNNSSDCVEIAGSLDHVRDSKNPGVELRVQNLALFLRAVKG